MTIVYDMFGVFDYLWCVWWSLWWNTWFSGNLVLLFRFINFTQRLIFLRFQREAIESLICIFDEGIIDELNTKISKWIVSHKDHLLREENIILPLNERVCIWKNFFVHSHTVSLPYSLLTTPSYWPKIEKCFINLRSIRAISTFNSPSVGNLCCIFGKCTVPMI